MVGKYWCNSKLLISIFLKLNYLFLNFKKKEMNNLNLYLKAQILSELEHDDFISMYCINKEFYNISIGNISSEFGNITENLYYERIKKIAHLKDDKYSYREFYYFVRKLINKPYDGKLITSLVTNNKLYEIKILYEYLDSQVSRIDFILSINLIAFFNGQQDIINWINSILDNLSKLKK